MIRKTVLGVVFVSAFVFVSSAYAGKVELTTYYPSPYGEYLSLTLAPTDTINPAAACSNGQMYFDASDGVFYDCVGSVWRQRASGVPRGAILMWSGSIANIPSGWVLCNGANGTPNLMDRFIVGAGSTYAVTNTGGATAASVTLTTAQMPSHTHSLSGVTASIGSSGAHQHNIDNVWTNGGSNKVLAYATTYNWSAMTYLTRAGDGSHTHTATLSGNSGSAGGVSAVVIPTLPPYYALCYIIKI